MRTQVEKAELFKALHEQDGAFIIPNPWDIATARLLEHLGFQALATTSAGYAFSLGQRDNGVSRVATMAHLRDLTAATSLPVSADLLNCFGDDPTTVAETIRLAAEAGVVGCSVEDATNQPTNPIYDFALAVERVRAAADAAHALPFPFTLTARAENYFVGRTDLEDTIHRLRAFRAAGADVVFPHGMKERADLAAVVRSVDCPVSVLTVSKGSQLDVEELMRIGVKRISVGPALFMAAMSAVFRAGREMREHGAFSFVDETENYSDLINAIVR